MRVTGLKQVDSSRLTPVLGLTMNTSAIQEVESIVVVDFDGDRRITRLVDRWRGEEPF